MSVAPPSIKRTLVPAQIAAAVVAVAAAQEKPDVQNLGQNDDVESTTQLDTLLEAFDAQIESLKELKKQAKAAIKAARKRRTPEQIAADAAKPKREQSEASKAWTDYVNRVYEEMKAADPATLRPAAMKEAARRRDAGDPDAPAKAVADDSASKASKESDKEARKAAREAEKAAKEEAKAAEKAAKEEAKAAAQAAKEEAKLAAQAAKEEAKAAAAAAKLAVQQAKEQAKALAAAAKATKSKPAAVASGSSSVAAAPVEEDEEALNAFLHKGKYYFRSSKNECWEAAADGQLGKWVGIYVPATNTFKPAPEPKLA